MRTAAIGGLLLGSRPAAIAGFVVPVGVDAIERLVFRTFAHVSEEVQESPPTGFAPALANRNAAPPVMTPPNIGWGGATPDHCPPRTPCGCGLLPMPARVRQCSMALPATVMHSAPATLLCWLATGGNTAIWTRLATALVPWLEPFRASWPRNHQRIAMRSPSLVVHLAPATRIAWSLAAVNGADGRLSLHRVTSGVMGAAVSAARPLYCTTAAPTAPRASLTYVDDESGEVDKHGVRVQRRVVGLPDPEAALIEAIWDSVESKPR